jgi:hypothetical protein
VVFAEAGALETSAPIDGKLDSLDRDRRSIGEACNPALIACASGSSAILGSYINKPIS